MNFLKPSTAKVFATVIISIMAVWIGFDCGIYPDEVCKSFFLSTLINIYGVPVSLFFDTFYIKAELYFLIPVLIIWSYILASLSVSLIKYLYKNKDNDLIKIIMVLIVLFLIFALVPFLVVSLI